MKKEEFTNYVTPMTKVVVVNVQSIICTSEADGENETYEEGSTSGWY